MQGFITSAPNPHTSASPQRKYLPPRSSAAEHFSKHLSVFKNTTVWVASPGRPAVETHSVGVISTGWEDERDTRLTLNLSGRWQVRGPCTILLPQQALCRLQGLCSQLPGRQGDTRAPGVGGVQAWAFPSSRYPSHTGEHELLLRVGGGFRLTRSSDGTTVGTFICCMHNPPR